MQTVIEQHFIPGNGSLLDFIEYSKGFGSWMWDDSQTIKAMKEVATCDDKEGRELMLRLIGDIEALHANGEELRKRIGTIETALKKINDGLKEPVGDVSEASSV